MKRSIRLKEFPPNTHTFKTASEAYIAKTDGSLQAVGGGNSFPLITNEQGFQTSNPEISSTHEIVLLGDSFVENLFVSPNARFWVSLESALQQQITSDITVLNGGVSGMTALQELNVLINKVIPLTKTVSHVLLFACMIDAAPLQQVNSYWTQQKLYSPINADDLPDKVEFLSQLKLTDLENTLSLAIQACLAWGIQPIVVATPFRSPSNAGNWDTDGFLSGFYRDEKQWKHNQDVCNAIDDAWLETGRNNNVPAIDGREFNGAMKGMFYDMLHLNDNGSKQFGVWLTNKLTTILAD